MYTIESRAGAAPRQITHYDVVHASSLSARPEWSPDGTRLVYLQTVGAKQINYTQDQLAVVAVAGGEPKVLAQKFDRPASSPRFSSGWLAIMFLPPTIARNIRRASVELRRGGEVIEGPLVVSGFAQGKDGAIGSAVV